MSKPVFEELSLAEPKNANMIVETTDKTRCIPQGIIENVMEVFKSLSFEPLVTREKTITEDREDLKKHIETKTRAIIEAMVNKLLEEWFLGVSKDKDDLGGIIHYLEPMLYDGFIDHDDEAYKQRRNNLLGIPYTEPPTNFKGRS
nr:hypothetical protein [Tanacetum cinerariifolium]